ncbi:hypothetical protein RJ640_012166 [Escallonia rubra]|uniref:Uncharacterized protein n=1 Tax=Escallonia rubra TaxID=112253 RepID=A0AA88RVG8_9ASTE|nr:hypothetical protein RJ640_012166 [Escallonia rubra]
MACTSSHLLSIRNARTATSISCKARALKPAAASLSAAPSCRRQWLFLLTATTVLKAAELPSRAQDIPLFGLRKKLKKAEEEAEEIVKEGFDSAEKGIEAAEKGIEKAEEEIETAVSFGGLAQAGVVAGAEVVGILVATSVVNGILGPEAQNS